MAAQVTLKMTAQEFDDLRKAVDLARETCRQKWQELKAQGADRNEQTPHYQFEMVCEKLLKNVLG